MNLTPLPELNDPIRIQRLVRTVPITDDNNENTQMSFLPDYLIEDLCVQGSFSAVENHFNIIPQVLTCDLYYVYEKELGKPTSFTGVFFLLDKQVQGKIKLGKIYDLLTSCASIKNQHHSDKRDELLPRLIQYQCFAKEHVLRILLKSGRNKMAKEYLMKLPETYTPSLNKEHVLRILLKSGRNKMAEEYLMKLPETYTPSLNTVLAALEGADIPTIKLIIDRCAVWDLTKNR